MATITLNIDGQEVATEEGKSVLAAALDAGIYVPHLCYHADLSPLGACRLCVVEIEGTADPPTSCTTPVAAGMVVRTKTPQVERIRRLALELMLSRHPADCTSCPKYGRCELQSLTQYLGVTADRFRRHPMAVPADTSNPLFLQDLTRCVLCGRCVRACRELRGGGVLDYRTVDGETRVGTSGGLSLADAGCRFCGACVEVCPTGALRDREGLVDGGVNRKAALVPCRTACPAGIDIPRYVRLVREGKPAQALAVIREKVPFPRSLGYVCNHPCEAACRRGEVNEAIAIRELKRYAAEKDDGQWKESVKTAPPTGRRVAVVGGGPAGLTAAYYLAKQGHRVTVFEALPAAGGMLRFGIPEYRLPTPVVAGEIREIEKAGVEIITNAPVESLDPLFAAGYAAVLVTVGTHAGVKLPIPGRDLPGVLVNTSFLRDVRLGNEVELGRRVVVLGGGPVAFDCARVARRLGASEVHVACLEAREEMPAGPEEIVAAEAEGVIIHPARTFVKIVEEKGRVAGVECLAVASCVFDADKRPVIEVRAGSEHVLPADTVIFAVGQHPGNVEGLGLTPGRGNTAQVDPATLAAGPEGVFAAGDAVTGTMSVIAAVAAGRRAAAAVDRYLGGDGLIDEVLAPVEEPAAWIGPAAGFAARCRPPSGTVAELTYDGKTAGEESGRCLQCDLRTMIAGPRFWGDFASRS